MATPSTPLPSAAAQADALLMDRPASPRPHRVMVNVDSQSLALLDEIAHLSRESRSAVVADILQTFLPLFSPMAEAIAKAREKPAEAVRMLRGQADSMQLLAGELVERAKGLQAEVPDEPGAGAAGTVPASAVASAQRRRPPPSNTGGVS